MTASIPALTLIRMIPAVPRDVFETWLDPNALMIFMGPVGYPCVIKTEVDARVGGKFLVLMKIGDQELPHHGEYLEIARHEHLAFTWLSHVAGEGSRVTLTFETAAHGHTRLTLEHVGLSDMDIRDKHEGGWTNILALLADHMAAR
jgi:uncharacterized protein YndB with AHSA1/START domain